MIASTLPTQESPPSRLLDPAAPGSATGASLPFTVLVIDDDAVLRALLRRTLEMEGYEVLEAANGELGLQLIESHSGRLDLVLTDIEMPRIDGITVAEVLAALRPLLGVICMSGSPEGEVDFVRRLGLRRQPFLAKPFTLADVVLMTADTLARSQELLAQAEAQPSMTPGSPVAMTSARGVNLVAAAQRLRAAHDGARSPGPSTRRVVM